MILALHMKRQTLPIITQYLDIWLIIDIFLNRNRNILLYLLSKEANIHDSPMKTLG